jgi:predicted PurR-regulated permease PerM
VKKIKSNIYSKYILIILFTILVVLAFLIVKPLITAALTACVIAYIFYPLYDKLNKKIKRKNISALIVSVLIILIITLPFFFIINIVSKETYANYIIAKQKIKSGSLFNLDCTESQSTACRISDFFKESISNPQVKYYLENTNQKVTSFIVNSASSFLFSVPMIILKFFIMLFITFYLFKDGASFLTKIGKLLPMKRQHQKNILKQFNDVTYAVIYGQLLIALAQGTLGTIGFFIFGVPSPIFWGAVMTFFALIPFIGTPIVWVPASLMLIISGFAQADNSLITKGILLLLYGIFIISTIDNILKPKIIGERAKLHPVLVLLGVLGGIKLFGIIGLVIGPLIFAILVASIRIYEEEK